MGAANPIILSSGLKITTSTPKTDEEVINNANLQTIDNALVALPTITSDLAAASAQNSVANITASATQTLAGATLITTGVVSVTVTNDGDGVRLNSEICKQTIVNMSELNNLRIWPNSSSKSINFGDDGAAFILTPRGRVTIQTV